MDRAGIASTGGEHIPVHRPRLPETDARRPPKSSAGRRAATASGGPDPVVPPRNPRRQQPAPSRPGSDGASARPQRELARMGQNGPEWARMGQNGPKALDSMIYGVFFPEWARMEIHSGEGCNRLIAAATALRAPGPPAPPDPEPAGSADPPESDGRSRRSRGAAGCLARQPRAAFHRGRPGSPVAAR